MPKGYWIARLDITNEAEYAEYRKLNAIAFAKYGGKFLTRGGAFEKVMGSARQHHVVIEFPSHEQAWPAPIHPNTRRPRSTWLKPPRST